MQPKLSWREQGYEANGQHPVTCLRRDDILAYLGWLSQKAGQTYRLPSEAEWEYAARAGTKTPAYWGQQWSEACKYQNGADLEFFKAVPKIPYGQYAECEDGYVYTAPVGRFVPNEWGFFDVAGNVSEWTADCYASSHNDIPTDGSPLTHTSCQAWVAKGGSWAAFPGLLRTATRLRIIATASGSGFGFRVARDASAVK